MLFRSRGPGRSPAITCIEPDYLFQPLQKTSDPQLMSVVRCRGADAVLLCTTDSGGYVPTCRWAELGVWSAGLGREEVGTDCTYFGNSTVIVLQEWWRLRVSGERQYCLLDETESCPVSYLSRSTNGSCSAGEKQGRPDTARTMSRPARFSLSDAPETRVGVCVAPCILLPVLSCLYSTYTAASTTLQLSASKQQ